MPMNGIILGDAIRASVDAAVAGLDPSDSAALREAVFRAIGAAVVAHVVANAQVIVVSVSGVTPGGGVSGPGTGTVI